MSTVRQIDVLNAESKALDIKREFLKTHGWKCSCKYPGGLWLWSNKELKLRGCDTKIAFKLQERLL